MINETELMRLKSSETKRYLNQDTSHLQTPKITKNPDVWLQETIAILTETSVEMLAMMSKNPKEVLPFMRVFSLVTTLAADSRKMLQQGGGKLPPVAPGANLHHNDGMEARIIKLEDFAQDTRDRLARIETKLDGTATKTEVANVRVEMHKEFHSMTWKIIGSQAALVAVVYFIVKYVAP